MYKKVLCTCEVVVSLIKPFFFLFFYVLVAVHLSTRRWILKSLFRICASAIGANKGVKFFI